MKWSPLAEKVHQSLIRNALVNQHDNILLAVSGGLDSVVLLHLFIELQIRWNWKLIIGHINHGLRPEYDKQEAQFCEALAKKHKLTYVGKTLNLLHPDEKKKYSPKGIQNPSIESLARAARYRIFEEWANTLHCNVVVTAHQANDQAETIIYRMLTGAGIDGLSGIPEKRGIFRRPLREILRSELETYAQKQNLSFCEDLSNKDERFARNKIRHTVIPAIKNMGFENIEQALAHSAQSLQDAGDALQVYEKLLIEKNIRITKSSVKLYCETFKNVPIYMQRRLLQYIYRDTLNVIQHISRQQLDQLCDFIARSDVGHTMEIAGHILHKDRECIIWYKKDAVDVYYKILCKKGIYLKDKNNNSIQISVIKSPDFTPYSNPSIAYFSPDILGKTLIYRSWVQGDKMTLFGLGDTKKISDILKDEKLKPYDKKYYPVLMLDNEIIWIPGVKRSNVYRVENKHTDIVMITYKKTEQTA